MHRIYRAILGLGRWFFAKSGLPVPKLGRRVQVLLRNRMFHSERGGIREELEALTRAVERLETAAYIERIGRPRE